MCSLHETPEQDAPILGSKNCVAHRLRDFDPEMELSSMKCFSIPTLVPTVIGVLFAAMFLVVMFEFGRLPNIDTDEIFYKAAGRELALTGRFAAPELSGVLGVNPPAQDVWLLYPPLYPLLFGGVVKFFGFGWMQCVMYDACIKVLLAAVTWGVVRRLSGNGARWLALCAGVSVLLMARGVIGRPDELATAMGMAGLLPLVRPEPGTQLTFRKAAVSGLFFGLCAGTSAVAAIVLGCVALVFFVARAGGIRRFVILGLVWGAVVVAAFAALVVPILWNHPDAYRQYFGLAKVIFQSDTRSHWGKIAALVTVGWRVTVPVIGILALGTTTFLGAVRRGNSRNWATIWSGPLAGLAFILLVDPHLYTYVWFLGPYVLAASMASLSDPALAPRPRWPRLAYASLLVLLVALGSVETIRQTAIFASLPREQSIRYNAELVRQVVPPGAVVLSYDAWWFLGDERLVYDPNVPEEFWEQVDYVVVKNFKGMPRSMETHWHRDFVPISDNRSMTPTTLLGVPLSRTISGFGMLVKARRTEQAKRPPDGMATADSD